MLDKNVLEQLDELQKDGTPDIVLELINSFFKTSPKHIEIILECLAGQDLSGAARRAHTLKASAQIFGANELENNCQEIEDNEKTKDLSCVQRLIDSLSISYSDTCKELGEIKIMRELKK